MLLLCPNWGWGLQARDPSTGVAGVTAAVRAYGTLMQKLHGTTRISTDATMTGLQYQTDNGAQYCFCTAAATFGFIFILFWDHCPTCFSARTPPR